MTPREKLINKLAEKIAHITDCGDCQRPVEIIKSQIGKYFYTCNKCGFICEERPNYELSSAQAEAIIDYLKLEVADNETKPEYCDIVEARNGEEIAWAGYYYEFIKLFKKEYMLDIVKKDEKQTINIDNLGEV